MRLYVVFFDCTSPERYERVRVRSPSGSNRLQRLQESVREGAVGDHVGGRKRVVVGIGDGVGLPGNSEHLGVVLGIADGDELLRVTVEQARGGLQPLAFVDLGRFDVVSVAGVDHVHPVVGGDALQRFQRSLPGDGEFGLTPAVHHVDRAPPEVVARFEVVGGDRVRSLGVAVVHHFARLLDVHRAAVLGDDVQRNPEELTEADGVREGLPGGDDDGGLPRAKRIEDAGVDGLVRPGERSVDVGGQRRYHTGVRNAAGIKPPPSVRRYVTVTHALDDIYTVDPHLMETPGALTLYLIDAPKPTIVDTGAADSVDRIHDALSEVGIAPEAVEHVLVTHVHLDHAGGAGHLADDLPNATFHVHEKGLPYVTDSEQLNRLKRSVDRAMGTENAYGEPKLLPEERCRSVGGGEVIDLGDRELELVDAPGHAPHHFAAYDPATEGLFSIDSAGMHLAGEMRPTTPPPGFDLEANLDTVARLREFDPEKNFYGHVGPGGDDAVGELDRYEEMLPEWVDLLAERRQEHDDDIGAIVESLADRWLSPTVQRDVAGVLQYLDNR
jgi:glyoxylase-like metal-dependent hydrolase (beta-lactamase superfamily II)